MVADSGSGKSLRLALTAAVGWELLALQSETREEIVEIVFADLRGYRELRRGCWLWRNLCHVVVAALRVTAIDKESLHEAAAKLEDRHDLAVAARQYSRYREV